MYIKTSGLVLRETEYKESSRILTVLTSTEGKITVSARGSKRKGSRTAAATQLLTFSNMELFAERGRYVLTEANSVEEFRGLRDDIVLLALGAYVAEVLEAASDEDQPNPEMLTLGLNTLYALGESRKDPRIVKAAFELRLACLAGFEPDLRACAVCGRRDMAAAEFSFLGGVVWCGGCRPATAGETVKLLPGTLEAMRYITGAELKRFCAFSAGEDALKQLSRVCENYLLTQLGRGFGSLDYYRSVT